MKRAQQGCRREAELGYWIGRAFMWAHVPPHSTDLLAIQSAIEKVGTTTMIMPVVAITCCESKAVGQQVPTRHAKRTTPRHRIDSRTQTAHCPVWL